MAFMMPLMKNDYDIYKDNRSRKASVSSNSNANSSAPGSAGVGASGSGSVSGGASGNRRKISECKSENFALSPTHNSQQSSANRLHRCQSSRAFPRNASRNSSSSLLSPTRSFSATKPMSSPPPYGSSKSSSSFSATATTSGISIAARASVASTSGMSKPGKSGTGNKKPNDMSSFHTRLVDKLRKSFRKDKADRS